MKDYLFKVIVLAALLFFISILSFFIKKHIEKKEQIPQEITVIEQEVKNPLLDKSIEFCNKEFSEEIAVSVLEASKKYNIPVYVIYAIIATESGEYGTNKLNIDTIMSVNKNANSKYNCIGLMQVSKYALADYNKYNGTNYSLLELYKIPLNIEIGTWFYSQFDAVATSWSEQYVIYNVGYGDYNKKNNFIIYDTNGNKIKNLRNSYYYMNNVRPPRKNGFVIDELPKYDAKKRFAICLDICKEYFSS